MPPSLRTPILALALAGCGPGDDPTQAGEDALDLTVALASGQVRAGFVSDERALWGGPAAEARTGDVKLYNDRVRFAIQALREGDYYIGQGGHLVDADLVRPPGEPGQDMVDEWLGMAGFGRLVDPDEVVIEHDGRDGRPAVVRVSGGGSTLNLLEGVIEAWGELVPDLGLQIEHRYILEPDSWLLEVQTTVRATDTAATLQLGDGLLPAGETTEPWIPGFGYASSGGSPVPWTAQIGVRNEIAMGLFSADGEPKGTAGVGVLTSVIQISAAFEEQSVELAPGESVTWTRWWGVGPDLATLTDAWQARRGVATERVGGIVTDPEGPVAGARVTVVVDGAPFTLARTGEDGSWGADVPAGSTATWVVDGRGPGLFFDLPEGAAHYGHLAPPAARQLALRTLTEGGPAIPLAQGHGVAEGDAPLGLPAELKVVDAEGLPFEVRLLRLDPEPEVDPALVRARPAEATAAGWTADGSLSLQVEPGSYQVIVHRGPRYERQVSTLELVGGLTSTLPVSLEQTTRPEGWLFGDPHNHAGPSPDGRIAMVHRLLNQAGTGVQLHFGTDHDHVADYGALIGPLGLEGRLATVPSTEVSPTVRGHLNVYPLTQRGDRPNGGGWPWWRTPVEDTEAEFAALRTWWGGPLTGDGGVAIQVNHPNSGLLAFAGWSPGRIDRPELYSADYDALEVLVGGTDTESMAMYFDLVNRGVRVTPTGVSDSHGAFDGRPGLAGTWFYLGTDDPAAYTADALRAAMLGQHTVVSRGLFLDLSILPGSTVVGPATLEVHVPANSWVWADRIRLYRDGVEVDLQEGDEASFVLAPEVDASYVVIAEGDTSLDPLWSTTPWALSAAIRVDVDGDGWTPPLPPLVLE